MKQTVESFGQKLQKTFLGYAGVIFAVLWLLQTVLLQTCCTSLAVAGLRRSAREVAGAKDGADFFTCMEERAREGSLLIFLTDPSGGVLFSVDAYSSLYGASGEGSHGSGNPYLSGGTLSWEKGALRNLPGSHSDLIARLAASGETSLGYETEDGAAYVYAEKLGPCAALDGEEAILCVSMALDSAAGTARILRLQLLWVSLLALALAVLLARVLSRRFEKPIRGIAEQAGDLARGEFRAGDHRGFCTELDELADTLNGTAAELERLERSRRELLANISHDLRTPLTMIKGYAEMVRDISWSQEEQREHDLAVITREADRLTALVNEILEYSSLQSLRQAPAMAVFDLSAAAEEVAGQFEALCREQGIPLERSVAPGLRVRGEEEGLRRVVYNFLDNALQHTGPGRPVTLSLEAQEGRARLSVRDRGPGIPEEELPHVWERYYTARSRKNKETVSGLGLAIAREILTLHGASFGVYNEEGAVFWFELDLAGEG